MEKRLMEKRSSISQALIANGPKVRKLTSMERSRRRIAETIETATKMEMMMPSGVQSYCLTKKRSKRRHSGGAAGGRPVGGVEKEGGEGAPQGGALGGGEGVDGADVAAVRAHGAHVAVIRAG